jgi:hypothetical protein
VFINVLESDAYKRGTYGITYPTCSRRTRKSSRRSRRSRSPASRRSTAARIRRRRAARSTPFRTTTTWCSGRHTFKAGIVVEYSGEDDFDQINVSAIPGSTNNQNGRSSSSTAVGRRHRPRRRQRRAGLFTNYAEIGQRNFTQWRSLATDCSSRTRGSRRRS